MRYEIRRHGRQFMVWDTTAGYAVHVGSEQSCREYISNVSELFGGGEYMTWERI